MNHHPPVERATTRFLKAYFITLIVLLSYSWFNFISKFISADSKEARISKLHKRNVKRIEKTIISLQGLFIKVGQFFSIMTNFLPDAFRNGLENLQDSVPARPFEQIEKRIIEELGDKPKNVFASFEEKPIASASLGQVYKAVTHDGQHVAVKVQHIGVESIAHADLRTILRLLRLIKRFVKTKGLDNYYTEIKMMILEELDFSKEASSIEEISKNFESNSAVIFPKVIKELSTSRVLTLEYLDGVKVTDTESLIKMGINPSEIAKNLLTTYCQMVFVDGHYHADPHPGNILVQKDGKLILLDFGAVGHLSSIMRAGIGVFLEALIKGDEQQLLNSLKSMGFLRVGTDQTEAATSVIEHFHRKFQDEIKVENFSLSSIHIDTNKGFEHLADLKEMNIGLKELSSAFHMPREWVLLERTGLLLTGICTHLDPQLNPASTIRPYLEEFVLGKDRDWSQMLFDLTRDKLLSFLSLPKLFEKYVNRAITGRLSFKVDGLRSSANLVYLVGQQLMFSMLICATAGVGIYFHHMGEQEFAKYAVYAGGSLGILLLSSMLKARKHK